jgi:hypothetical protein
MKPEGYKEKVLMRQFGVDRFRLYCLSGIVFVELVAAYGVAFMLFFRLQLDNKVHPYMKGWVQYVVLSFMIIGTMLAGRTGFLGLLLGFLLWFIFAYNRLLSFLRRNIVYIVLVSAALVIVFNFLLPAKQRNMFKEEVFPFAFELYYNYRDYGSLNVTSLDATESQYFPLRDETLLFGHGDLNRNYVNYPHSDAGYINNLIFGGVPYLVFLIIYQCFYFLTPIAITRRRDTYSNRADLALFLLLFGYVFLLNYKTPAIGTLFIIQGLFLIAGSSYLIRHYSQDS